MIVSYEESLDAEIAIAIEASHENEDMRCIYGAPFLCMKQGRMWRLVQGCCNSWTCPRCGQIRARKEYGRIVHGAAELDAGGAPLYFMTLTCRGKELDAETAIAHYMEWTNRLFTLLRATATRKGLAWHYAQVTELQGRGHPHSHVLTTFCPPDAELRDKGATLSFTVKTDTTDKTIRYAAKHELIFSERLWARAYESGLGSQTDLTAVKSAKAVAKYISKYLFKDATKTVFPKHWHRVRYSRSYPKLPEKHAEGFPVIKSVDWRRVATLDEPVFTRERVAIESAYANSVYNVYYSSEE